MTLRLGAMLAGASAIMTAIHCAAQGRLDADHLAAKGSVGVVKSILPSRERML